MYNPQSAAAQRTGSAVPDEQLARRRTAQNRQDSLISVLSAAGPCSFDKTLDSPVPGRQAARCTSLSKPLPGCRAPECEPCCLVTEEAADTLCRAPAALECEVLRLPSTGAFNKRYHPLCRASSLRLTYCCTLCVGHLMCVPSGSFYNARASECLF